MLQALSAVLHSHLIRSVGQASLPMAKILVRLGQLLGQVDIIVFKSMLLAIVRPAGVPRRPVERDRLPDLLRVLRVRLRQRVGTIFVRQEFGLGLARELFGTPLAYYVQLR